MVSHWDDRNKINTILPFELTVASRQRMAVKTWKNVGQSQSNKPRSE